MKLQKLKQCNALQDLAFCLGSYGRYLICLLAVIEELTENPIDLIRTVDFLVKEKLIDYNEKRPRAYKNSLYVFDANKILKVLGCEEYNVEKVKVLPKGYEGKYIIRHTLEGDTQFTLPDYKPFTYSNAYSKGRITAYYLIQKNI